MSDFVARMWTNPALRNASVQRKENQILGFVKDNADQLKGTLSKSDYFPDLTWDDIIRLLFTELTERVINSLEPKVDGVVKQLFQPTFFEATHMDSRVGEVSPIRVKEFLLSTMRSKSIRDHFIHSIDAITYRVFDRYIPVIMERRKVIYYEMIRRDRLEMDEQWLPAYLNFCTLFRPFFWYRVRGRPGMEETVSLSSVQRNKKKYEDVLAILESELSENMGIIPMDLYRPGIDSWLSSVDDPDLSGCSKLISIIVGRMQEMDPGQDRDRGAETPDKSWFNINRRTARFYGYDGKFLDELYQIAGEEGW